MEIFVDYFIWPILVSQMLHMPVMVAGLPVGVAGTIALPSFLSQAAKAKESEGKQNISSINRAQLAYFVEKSSFANTFDQLALGTIAGGSTSETSNYSYQITVTELERTVTTATAKDPSLRSYTGATFRYTNSANEPVINSIVCQTNEPSTTPPAIPQLVAGKIECAPGSINIR
jgi:type IV pilus assembly protein PilA